MKSIEAQWKAVESSENQSIEIQWKAVESSEKQWRAVKSCEKQWKAEKRIENLILTSAKILYTGCVNFLL